MTAMLPLRSPVLVHVGLRYAETTSEAPLFGEVRGRCWDQKAQAAVYDVLLRDGTWLPYVPAEIVEALS